VSGVLGPAEKLAGHPDRLRWNARYADRPGASFAPHPLAVRALAVPPPGGPVADLASGPSGAALLAAADGRQVTAVDISDVALSWLGAEASRRGLRGRITLVQADLREWRPVGASYALVLCTGYWDRAVFATAQTAVAPGGLLGWEAFTAGALRARPGLCPQWCLGEDEPAALLGAGFEVLDHRDLPGHEGGTKRAMLARRDQAGSHLGFRSAVPGDETQAEA
jgi:SAM-dependent methyltransferase